MLNYEFNNNPVRTIRGKVELYNGSTLADTFNYNGDLLSIEIERVGEESKFFGFGICQKQKVVLRDIERKYNITTANSFKTYFDNICNFPLFHVTEVNRNETTNELSITSYDAIERAAAHTVAELELGAYNISMFVEACANLLGLNGFDIGGLLEFDLYFEEGANFDGAETIREALNAVAEATQTIYYINSDNILIFKRLDISGVAALTIGKSDYFSLDSKTNRRLAGICSATELGDNVEATLEISGTTQYVRDNPFWELREEVAQLVESALANVGGMTINQFNCNWRGNYLLEIGDKIELITKDNQSTISYVFNDVIKYDGAFTEVTKWEYSESEETASNPTTLGEALKQTFAKVDKANKQVEIVASDVAANSSEIAALIFNTQSISASVSGYDSRINEISGQVEEAVKKANATMTDEEIKLEIEKTINENGVSSVSNTIGTFNEEGLTISKSDSEITTTISDDGMTVKKSGEALLTANNEGVKAVDLHATTYLIIGKNSRFEDLGTSRTACFWIGG